MITGNRGLAGGYNSNIVKLVTRGDLKKELGLATFLIYITSNRRELIKK